MTDAKSLQDPFLSDIKAANDLSALEEIRLKALGKQGKVTQLMKSLGKMSPEERQEKGPVYNALRQILTEALANRRHILEEQALEARLASEYLDVTLPVRHQAEGRIHPLSQAMFEAISILKEMGFSVAEGPHIEDDFYNFTALNIPELHPARQEQDTFYFREDASGQRKVLRTHTSPVQIRTMLQSKPPLRIIAPGRVFRSDYDQTHTPVFHQIEGLYVDKNIHMGHLKGCLIDFCRRYFDNPRLPVRFRPAYFPFTEPSAEVDIACTRRNGQLLIGEGEAWLEILGAGMVHRKVLENGGIDPDVYQGFAFGMGVERIAMLKYGIPDLRSFYDGDQRWLKHHGFGAYSSLMGGV
tara:strand:+ start:89 stop:1153 length:1065 start_codon:yes stop_codon:yes gene_type:complete